MRVMIIVGSVREGRIGLPIARWVESIASQREGVEVDFVDLKELALPFMDEPNHPRLQQYTHPHTVAWSERVQAADAVILVTPEYNHSYSPVLKNALDYLHHEWNYKPASVVSYGGVAAGTRSAMALHDVAYALKIFMVSESVNIPFVRNFLGDDGQIHPNQVMTDAAKTVLDELQKVAPALKPLRQPL